PAVSRPSSTSGNAPAARPGTAILHGESKNYETEQTTIVEGARAGGRRPDAGSLLARVGRPHFARGAGAGGESLARGRAHRRCRERGLQRREPGSAGELSWRGGRRRAGAPAR